MFFTKTPDIKRIILFFFVISFHASFSQVPPQHALSYPQSAFDADTCCWRKLSEDKKYLDAANLIIAYIKSNTSNNRHALNWHAGQMFAMAGENALAKKYFRKTYSVAYVWFGNADAKTWYYYAKGTIAFIDNDKHAMEKMIRKWRRKYPPGKNLEALERLKNHWDKSYEEASQG